MAFNVVYNFIAKDQFSNVTNKFSKSMKNVAVQANRARKSLVKATAGMNKFGKSMRDAGKKATVFATLPIALGFNKIINLASDAEETTNKFGEVFKGIGKKGSETVKQLGKDFKLADSTSQELLANTGDLLVGLGLTREKALQMSDAVVRLSSDVASFKNVEGGAERAANSLTKALLGERESLKDTFKTAINEQEVKERAIVIAQKLGGLTERQAKAMATLELVTERNADALGDFNRTQDAYANIVRINQEETKRMAESFGKLLLPVAVKVRRVVSSVVEWVDNLSDSNKKLILIALAVVAAIGPLLLIIGLLVPAITSLIVVAGTLGVTVAALVAPVLAAIGVIGLFTAAIVILVVKWEELVNSLSFFWNEFVNLFIKGAILFANTIKNVILAPLNLVGKVIGALGGETISTAISEIDKKLTIGADINSSNKSQTNIDVNVAGQPGTIKSAKSTTKGSGANIGFNVIEAV